MAGDLQIPCLQSCLSGGGSPPEISVTLEKNRLQVRPVELQEVNQPAAQVRITGGAAQRNPLQQTQGGCSRQPAIFTHPTVDTEQGKGQPPSVQADGHQMGQRAQGPGAPEQMQMAMFPIAAMAVVVAMCAAARVHQIARGVVLMLVRGGSGGESPNQGTVAFNQAQPVIESLPC